MQQRIPALFLEGVPVEHGQHALASRIYQNWVTSLDPRLGANAVSIQAVDFRGKPSADSVLFVRMKVRVAFAKFDQIVELRGGTVAMLPILDCEGVEYTVLVIQPRCATGNYELAEIPAGMIDGGTFGGAAAKEIREELGLVFLEDQLLELTDGNGIYLSPGLLDEQVRFYCARRVVSPAELAELQGKATGCLTESEQIVLKVIPLKDLPGATRDAKAFIALQLYQQLSLAR